MKIFNLLSLILAVVIFTGCAGKQEECVPTRVVETQKVYIAVPCESPKVKCDFKGNGFEPTTKLLACIVEQKRALEVCRSKPALVTKNGTIYKVDPAIIKKMGMDYVLDNIETLSIKE
jgi:hypothetical protein